MLGCSIIDSDFYDFETAKSKIESDSNNEKQQKQYFEIEIDEESNIDCNTSPRGPERSHSNTWALNTKNTDFLKIKEIADNEFMSAKSGWSSSGCKKVENHKDLSLELAGASSASRIGYKTSRESEVTAHKTSSKGDDSDLQDTKFNVFHSFQSSSASKNIVRNEFLAKFDLSNNSSKYSETCELRNKKLSYKNQQPKNSSAPKCNTNVPSKIYLSEVEKENDNKSEKLQNTTNFEMALKKVKIYKYQNLYQLQFKARDLMKKRNQSNIVKAVKIHTNILKLIKNYEDLNMYD